MKKLYYLMILALILGLVLTGCLLSNVGQVPTSEQSGITYLTKNGLLPDDLVALWHFSEGEGDTAYDSSGTIPPNDGTVYGAGWVSGKFGNALSFDGVNDYVEVPDSASLDITGAITLEAWIKPLAIPETGDSMIVSKWNHATAQRSYILFIRNKKLSLHLSPDGTTFILLQSTDMTSYISDWVHVAGTFDGTTARIYINGVAQSVSATTTGIYASTTPVYIGSYLPTDLRSFKGLIDEVRIWKVALSPDQLGKVYDFAGFFSPVENSPTKNMVKAGRAIPVKFSLNGYQGSEIFAAGYPKSYKIDCATTVSLNELEEETVTAGGSSLSYDAATDQYIYVWKTAKDWDGCRRLEVKLKDGQSYYADFQFK